MGELRVVEPVLPLVCAFSSDPNALAYAKERSCEYWGPIALASPEFEFTETTYYAASMGERIRKCFWVFEKLADPGQLADWKLLTNGWENSLATSQHWISCNNSFSRPINIDPGYITPAKLVLASTKDHAHRIYLSQGIYAEITLMYRHGGWQHHEWTFPDYRRGDYQEFFAAARRHLKELLAGRERQ
ncbi:MAG: DUF4416 family protein [Pirellulales bacterium]|nr:DUF4416 family protein [Pirellulales bacterium]